MKQLNINGAQISFSETGTGPALLLVHGFPLDHSMWQHQIDPLSKNYRVICPDLPGFGDSKPGSAPLTLKRWADDLAAFLDSLKIERVTFCGLSMGGYIGWQFWKHHSNRLERLIACDTRAAADSDTVARGRQINAQAVRERGLTGLAAEMIPKLFAASSLSNRPEDVQQIRQVISSTPAESVAQAQLAMAGRPDATDWLPQFKLPTLFIVGQHDSITSPTEMLANCKLVSGAQYVEISNAGHLSPLENPVEFNQAVHAFLSYSP